MYKYCQNWHAAGQQRFQCFLLASADRCSSAQKPYVGEHAGKPRHKPSVPQQCRIRDEEVKAHVIQSCPCQMKRVACMQQMVCDLQLFGPLLHAVVKGCNVVTVRHRVKCDYDTSVFLSACHGMNVLNSRKPHKIYNLTACLLNGQKSSRKTLVPASSERPINKQARSL